MYQQTFWPQTSDCLVLHTDHCRLGLLLFHDILFVSLFVMELYPFIAELWSLFCHSVLLREVVSYHIKKDTSVQTSYRMVYSLICVVFFTRLISSTRIETVEASTYCKCVEIKLECFLPSNLIFSERVTYGTIQLQRATLPSIHK